MEKNKKSDKEILAIMYDFYNKNTLRSQNDDIDYYKSIIIDNGYKNVLIVGAGTGRIAIPLSDYASVDALDFDKERLNLLSKKCKKINTIHSNFLDYLPSKKYDLIIFPYSTIQFGKDVEILNNMIKHLSEYFLDFKLCLLDFSENFNYKEEKEKEKIFENYCLEMDDTISVFYTAKQYPNLVEFIIEYHLNNNDYSVIEHEYYSHYDRNKIEKTINQNGLEIIHINDGYGEDGFNKKHVFFIKRR